MDTRKSVRVSDARPNDVLVDGATIVARIIRVDGDDIAAKLNNDGEVVFWNKSRLRLDACTLPVRAFIRDRFHRDTGITLGGSLNLVR
jgi:hypothetical protein